MSRGPLVRLRGLVARAEEEAGAVLAARVLAEAEARGAAAAVAVVWSDAVRAREAAERPGDPEVAPGAELARRSRYAGRLRGAEAAHRQRCAEAREAVEEAAARAVEAQRAFAAARCRRERVEARLAAEALARRAVWERAEDEVAAEGAAACSARADPLEERRGEASPPRPRGCAGR